MTDVVEGNLLTGEADLEFEDLFRSEYRRLGTALYLLVGNRSEAEDLAQEALARTYERWGRVRAMASPAGYVYRVALNLSRKRFRRIARERLRGREDAPSEDPTEGADRRLMIRQSVFSLTREQREALVLVEWLDLSADQAGSLLGISAESVRARVHRAKAALRSRFGGLDE